MKKSSKKLYRNNKRKNASKSKHQLKKKNQLRCNMLKRRSSKSKKKQKCQQLIHFTAKIPSQQIRQRHRLKIRHENMLEICRQSQPQNLDNQTGIVSLQYPKKQKKQKNLKSNQSQKKLDNKLIDRSGWMPSQNFNNTLEILEKIPITATLSQSNLYSLIHRTQLLKKRRNYIRNARKSSRKKWLSPSMQCRSNG